MTTDRVMYLRPGWFYIVRNVPNGGTLESHATLSAAEHALDVVNQHEEKNSRGPDYWKITTREQEEA